VLLSSLEGAAITSLKVDGAMHEFATIDGRCRKMSRHRPEPEESQVQGHTRDEQRAVAFRE